MPSSKVKGNNGRKPKQETKEVLKETAPLDVVATPPIEQKQEAISSLPKRLEIEGVIVRQPKPVNGRLTKEDRKKLKTVLLWKDPTNLGGGIIWASLVPGANQRPYYYLDKIAGLGLKWRINTLLYGGDKVREPVYFMQEWYVDGEYIPGPYEPGPLTENALSPARRHHIIDWARWKAYILHKAVGWKDLIKVGAIVLAIIVALIIFFMAWRANIAPRPVIEQPANTTAAATQTGVK